MTKSDYSFKYISMKTLFRLLLIIVLFSFSGNHLKGETSVPVQTVVATAVDSLHNQLTSELDEKYKFKAYYLDNREKTVDWWLEVLGILVSFFGVIVPIALLVFANKQSRLNKKQLYKIDTLTKETEAKVEKTIKESETKLKGMIDRADYYLDKIIKNKEKSDKILAKNRKYQSSKSNNLDTFSNIPEQKSEEYLKPNDQIESNETNDSDALNSLCKLADNYLFIPNRLDEARAIWNIIVKDFKLNKKDLAYAYYKMAEIERSDKTGVDLSLKIFTLFDLAIQLDPENEYYYWKRAEEYSQIGKNGEAETDLTIAIKLASPDNKAALLYHRGNIRSRRGKYSLAIEDFDEALQQDEKSYLCYIGRAIARRNLSVKENKKQYKEALSDFLVAYHTIYLGYDFDTQLSAYELAICLKDKENADRFKGVVSQQDDPSAIADYLNLLYEIIFEQKTEFNLGAIEIKLKDYKFEIDWPFNIAKDLLVRIKNETATRLLTEYEQLINKHNEQFKAV
jgi:tetratricopeptide (TPR) repeat protein